MKTHNNMRDHLELITLLGNKIVVGDSTFKIYKLKKLHNLDNKQLKEVIKWFNEKHRYNDLVCFQNPEIIAECFKQLVSIGLGEIRQNKLDELIND